MQIAFKQDKPNVKYKVSIWERIKTYFKNPSNSFYYFLFMFALGIVFFSASLFSNSFTTPFGGDYTAQEIPFYTHGYDTWWEFFTTGHFNLYDTNTFLGVNNVGSNSFYYLFDPFFFPILLCPRDYIAQGMAILTIIKICCAGLFFHFYLKYIGVKRPIAKIGGLAYAFCGWMGWYLWFNHMTEIVTVFPLMLWGVEKVLKEKKPWLLAFSVLFMGLTNYYFCVSMTICAFLYAMFRYFQGLPKHKAKDNLAILGMGIVGFGIGCLLACVILLPTCLYAIQTSRGTSSYLKDLATAVKGGEWNTFFNLIFSWEKVDYYYSGNTYRTVYPIIEFIFPPVTCRNIPLIRFGDDSYEPEACSLFVYIPIMIFFVPALIKSCREKHFSPLIGTALFVVMLMTPFCYYMFHGFSQPYSRWTLFFSSSIIAYVCLYLNNLKEEPKWMVFIGAASLICLVVVGAILGQSMLDAGTLPHGTKINERIPIVPVSLIEGGYICLVAIVIYLILRFKKKWLYQTLTLFTTLEISLVGIFIVEGHGVVNYNDVNNGWGNNIALSALTSELNKKDTNYFRAYSSLAAAGSDNDGMRNNYNGTNFFHSLYNFNVNDFCNWIGSKRSANDWGTFYSTKDVTIDTFLGIKYYFQEKGRVHFADEDNKKFVIDNYHANVPYGYVDISEEYPNSVFSIYKNLDHVNFAFSFDSFYTTQELPKSGSIHEFYGTNALARGEAMISSAILYPKDAKELSEKYPHFTDNGDRAIFEGTVYSKYNLDFEYYDILNRTDNEGQDKQTYGPWLTAEELLSLDPSNEIFPCITYEKKDEKPDSDDDHWGRYVVVIKPSVDSFTGELNEPFPYDKDGIGMYLGLGYESSNSTDVDVYLVDDNNKFIVYDDHNDSRFWDNECNLRGFYSSPSYTDGVSNEDAHRIAKIILCPRNKDTVIPFSYHFDTYSQYSARLQVQKDYPITDIKYVNNDYITFNTNYVQERIIVTQMAYENGWTVSCKNNGKVEELEVFQAQGGFAAFVAPSGSSSYEMRYYTPYLRMGSLVSAVGSFTFFATYVGYIYLSLRKKPKEICKIMHR